MKLTEAIDANMRARHRRDLHLAAWKAADSDAPGYVHSAWSDEFKALKSAHDAAHRLVMQLVTEQLNAEFPEAT
jgi:hypothetical protein